MHSFVVAQHREEGFGVLPNSDVGEVERMKHSMLKMKYV